MKIVPQYDKLTNQLLIDTRFSKKPTNIPEAVVNPGRKLYKHNQLQSLENPRRIYNEYNFATKEFQGKISYSKGRSMCRNIPRKWLIAETHNTKF